MAKLKYSMKIGELEYEYEVKCFGSKRAKRLLEYVLKRTGWKP